MIEKWNKEWNYEEKLSNNLLHKHSSIWRIKPDNLPEEMKYDERFSFKGKIVNNLQVLYPCAKNRKGTCIYLCKCFCGTYFLTNQNALKKGRIHSCGCKHKENMIKSIEQRGIREDLTGKIFGKLTVIKAGERDKNGLKWLCQCECGNQIQVLAGNLKRGNTTTCGCSRKENPGARKDLTSFRKGKLVVLGEPSIGERGTLWKCQCDCGNIVYKYAQDLVHGNVSSCGCLKAELIRERHNLIGKKFGKLTVVEDTGRTDNFGQILWKCKCDCGNETEVRAGNLVKGNTTSCGCINSRGNTIISQWLAEREIRFEQEATFKDCLSENGYNMRYDFKIYYDESNNFALLEYDGDIHFAENINENGWNTKEAFEIRHNRDLRKTQWAKDNNIILYRISYKENIEERMEEIINELRSR